MVDEGTSPPQLSYAELDIPIPIKPKKKQFAAEMEEEEEEQEIYAVAQAGTETSQFPSPMATIGNAPLTRVEKARLLNAGFKVILDEDGHRPVTVGSSLRGSEAIRINLDAEKQDLRHNEMNFTFMGITFNAELFQHFGGIYIFVEIR